MSKPAGSARRPAAASTITAAPSPFRRANSRLLGFDPFDANGQFEPAMASGAPIQLPGFWKIRIAKAADRNAQDVRQRFQPGEDGHAARRAEVGVIPAAGCRGTPPAFELAVDFGSGF